MQYLSSCRFVLLLSFDSNCVRVCVCVCEREREKERERECVCVCVYIIARNHHSEIQFYLQAITLNKLALDRTCLGKAQLPLICSFFLR